MNRENLQLKRRKGFLFWFCVVTVPYTCMLLHILQKYSLFQGINKPIFYREFAEEALWETDPSIVAPLWKKGKELYRGYVDDPRNTDNAWMETVAFNFHDDGGILDKVQFKVAFDCTTYEVSTEV